MKKFLFGFLVSCLCFTSVAFARTTSKEAEVDQVEEVVENQDEKQDEKVEEVVENVAADDEAVEETTKKKSSKKSAKKTEEDVVEDLKNTVVEKPAVKSDVQSKMIPLTDETALMRLATILGKGKDYSVNYVSHEKLDDCSYMVTLNSTDKFRNGNWIVDIYNCASDNYRVMEGYDSYFTLYNMAGKAIGVAQAKKVR